VVSMDAGLFANYLITILQYGYLDLISGNMTTNALIFVSLIIFAIFMILAILYYIKNHI